MKKFSAFLFLSLFLFVTTSLFADCNRDKDKSSHFCGGTFVATRSPPTASMPILDQYIFNADGTAYWNQSTSLNFPVTQGTFMAEVGTWKRIKDRIILTTIGAVAAPVTTSTGADVNLSNYTRTTQEFKVINKNTLQAIHRVSLVISFDQDPINSPGTLPPLLNSCAQFFLRRVQVTPSDLTNNPC